MAAPKHMIDAHHHLWNLDHCRYPWLMEKGVKRFFGDPTPIQENYLIEDFRSDIGSLRVIKSVHIQVGVDEEQAVEETKWLQSIADKNGLPHAIVAFCDLTRSNRDKIIDQHQDHQNLRGVRQIVGRDAKEDARNGTNALIENKAFKEGLIRLAKRELSFDLQLTPPLLEISASLFKSIPNLAVALCHAASPQDFSTQGLQLWRAGLKSWAEHENMICKISGFGMFDHDWTAKSIRDKVLTVIDCFGPERVAFGSNFPVDKLHADYQKVMGAYLEITSDFSQSEINAMFYDTAARFYRI